MRLIKPQHCWAAILLAAVSLTTHAQPKLSCPMQLHLLSALSGTEGMDKLVYGLPVRQWTPEHLTLAQRQYESCLASSTNPQSLKDAERKDGNRQFDLLRGTLQQRDRVLGLQAREQAGQSAAAQAGDSVTQRSGRLEWTYTTRNGDTVVTCDQPEKLPADLLSLTPKSQQEFPRFYAACVQVQQIPPRAAALFKDSVDELTRERQAQASFITAMQQATRLPAQQTHRSVRTLEDGNRFGGSSDPVAQAASQQLKTLRQQVDAPECAAHASEAGVPAELNSALYLWRYQEPVSFLGLVCGAVRNGAVVKFSPKGVLSRDSLEMRSAGKPAVSVTLQRQPTGDDKLLALIPVSSRVGDRSEDTTRANWPQLTSALQDAAGIKRATTPN